MLAIKSIRNPIAATAVLGLTTVLATGPSRAQQTEAQIANQVVQDVVRSHIYSVIDDVFDRRLSFPAGMPPGFANDPYHVANDPYYEEVFRALGYAGTPMVTKAMPTKAPPVAANPVMIGAWASFTVDLENSTGTFNGANIGARSQTYSGIGGIDFARTRVFADNDALLMGLLGGDTVTNTQPSAGGASTTTYAATGGFYAAYIRGDFSEDWSATATPTRNVTGGLLPATSNLDTFSFSNNVQYRINLPDNKWWIEPTVGYSYSDGIWSQTQRNAGFQDNIIWRVQGGARVGTSFMLSNGVRVEPTFTGLLYSDVKVTGSSSAPALIGIPQVPTDQGQLWGKADAKLNFVFADNLSAYVEGQIHGTGNNGTGTTVGGAATVGVRKTW